MTHPAPARLAVGGGNAFFVHGTVRPPAPVRTLSLGTADGRHPVATRISRWPSSEVEWWAIVPVEEIEGDRTIALTLIAELRERGSIEAPLGMVALSPGGTPRGAARAGSIAICMATHNPPPELFRRQIDSIRSQTHPDWVCLISDDASAPERLDEMRDAIGGDDRFRLDRSERRLGFYLNFERALGMVPVDAAHVALSDQDDTWHPDKLATLASALSERHTLAYADMRITDEAGGLLADSYWTHRAPNHTNLEGLLLGNSITGAAAMFQRSLLDLVLPFPPPLGRSFHDHWLAVVALAAGDVAYVDRPLHDYVQHPGSVIGYAEACGGRDPAAGRPAAAAARLRRIAGRSARPQGRQRYFADYCRIALMALVLDLRCGESMDERKRAAVRGMLALDESAAGVGRLAARCVRSLGSNEALGVDRSVLAGVLWRRLGRRL